VSHVSRDLLKRISTLLSIYRTPSDQLGISSKPSECPSFLFSSAEELGQPACVLLVKSLIKNGNPVAPADCGHSEASSTMISPLSISGASTVLALVHHGQWPAE
jgi:hypothetical protein